MFADYYIGKPFDKYYGWRIRRGTSFHGIDGNIIHGLALHHIRRLTIS
jgi:hypothetical protein